MRQTQRAEKVAEISRVGEEKEGGKKSEVGEGGG